MNIDDLKQLKQFLNALIVEPLKQEIADGLRKETSSIRDELRRFALQKEVYTVKESAEKLNIPKSTLYTYMEAGKIKSIEVGGKKMITKDEIIDFLNRVSMDANSGKK